MIEESLPLAEMPAKAGDGDFLRNVAETVVQMPMEADVEGVSRRRSAWHVLRPRLGEAAQHRKVMHRPRREASDPREWLKTAGGRREEQIDSSTPIQRRL